MTNIELWKDIPGYEGRYQVSDWGRIRSCDRAISFSGYTLGSGLYRRASTRTFKGKMLRLAPYQSGHMMVMLGRKNHMSVHVAVALAFIGPKPAGCEVLHLDHDPKNNRLSNLKWGTRSENIKMDYEVGARNGNRKVKGAV